MTSPPEVALVTAGGAERAARDPKVSVVIPCYNLGAYLDQTVQSVLDQTYGDFEIVIVNDGSTDSETTKLLADYRRPKTRVVSMENRGLGTARNIGIGAAVGRYICALDADDLLVPTFLEKAVRLLDESPDTAFVSCWLETFGDEQWMWRPDRCDLAVLLAECTVCTASLVRKSAVDAVGGYDERMPLQGYEDWDFWITLVEKGFRGTIIPEVLFRYRRRAGSMSSICCVGDGHLELMRYLIDKHRQSYERHQVDVLARKDADTAELLRTNDELEREIQTYLLPTIELRREELQRLQRRLNATERACRAESGLERLDDLEHALQEREGQLRAASEALAAAAAEIEDLHRSRSWKITAPLRAAYRLLSRAGGRS